MLSFSFAKTIYIKKEFFNMTFVSRISSLPKVSRELPLVTCSMSQIELFKDFISNYPSAWEKVVEFVQANFEGKLTCITLYFKESNTVCPSKINYLSKFDFANAKLLDIHKSSDIWDDYYELAISNVSVIFS